MVADIMKLIEEHDLCQLKNATLTVFYIDKYAFMSDGTIHEIKYACDNNLHVVFMVAVPWENIYSWCRWRVYRYGMEKGRCFYRWDDLRSYIKGKK